MMSASWLPSKEIERFQGIWFGEFGKTISLEEARFKAERFLVAVAQLLGRKTGEEKEAGK